MAESLTPANLPEIIQRYIDGESIQTIAADAHVARRTIYKWMHRVGDKDYYDLVTDALVTRLADADHALSTAETMGHIARASHEARFTRWDLERRRPHLFGQKIENKHEVGITVIVQRATPQPVDIPAIAHDVVEQVIDPATGSTLKPGV